MTFRRSCHRQPTPKAEPEVPDSAVPCEYVVGDVVWARISGYPLWPAIVVYETASGQFSRVVRKAGEWRAPRGADTVKMAGFLSRRAQRLMLILALTSG